MLVEECKELQYINFEKIKFPSATSSMYIDKEKKYVLKKLVKYIDHDCHKREAYILNYLNNEKITWCPRLVYSDDSIIVTEYGGVSILTSNKPKDYEKQLLQILKDLTTLNLQHNDIKQEEILVKNNKISLCDFGWASLKNDLSIDGLFNGKSKPNGTTNDLESIKKIIKRIK